ncbi:MAG: RsmG family class I SAM-dependent methyltransferase [Acidimicrobiia bacterium]
MEHVISAARHAGLELAERELSLLATYGEWLSTEGYRAGGIGPEEISRIELRHLADSLLFATPFDSGIDHVIDLGTGVGLPGIPLAIAMPDIKFTLTDRSQRRIDLVRRVIRILELENCQAVLGEIQVVGLEADTVVARASLPPDRLRRVIPRLLRPGGLAVMGGSWQEPPSHHGWETMEIPPDVLDRPIWLLMMRSA